MNMENAVKRIGVLTSGGDAPGMNACIRAVVRSAVGRGIECVGIRRGWNGLINGDIIPMDNSSVSRIINRGGTMLYTARSDEFRTEAGQQKAVNTCKLLGLDGIVAIGGDGTFRGAQELSKHGIAVVGIPGTIDEDIVCTEYTIGFDTAANTAVECIDRLRDTIRHTAGAVASTPVTGSIGVAVRDAVIDDQAWLRRADEAHGGALARAREALEEAEGRLREFERETQVGLRV